MAETDVTTVELDIAQLQLTKVIVYDSNCAQLERVTSAESVKDAAGGSVYRINLRGLPDTLDADSLRVTSPDALQLLDVEHSYNSDEQSEAVTKLRDSLSLMRAQKELNQHKMDTLRQFGLGIASTGSTTPFAVLDKYLDSVTGRGVEYHVKDREIDSEIAKLEKELQEVEGGVSRTRRCVLTFKAHAATTKPAFTLTYSLYNAHWTPMYRVHQADSDADNLLLEYMATVYNNTGEDWLGVQLALSTSTPTTRAEIPELVPCKAQIKRRRVNTRAMAKTMTVEEPDMLCAMPYAEDLVTVQNNTLSSTYSVTGKSHIKSHAQATKKVNIAQLTLPASLKWVCVPSHSENAYLESEVHNTSSLPLLSGDAMVFMDGELVAHSTILTSLPDAHFKLGLGVDTGVKVKTVREADHYDGVIKGGLLDRFSADTRMQSRTKENVYEIHNAKHRNAVSVQIKAQVPVSVDERVLVNIQEPMELSYSAGLELLPAKWIDKDEGTFARELRLDYDKKHKLAVKYDIKWPEGEELEL